MKHIFVLLLALFGTPVWAAGIPNSFITPQTPNLGLVRFVQGTDAAGTFKTAYTAGANGSKCFSSLLVHNDQTVTHQILIQVTRSAVPFIVATYTTVIGLAANINGPSVNLMATANWSGLPGDNNGNGFFELNSGDILQMTFVTALSAADIINIAVQCGDY